MVVVLVCETWYATHSCALNYFIRRSACPDQVPRRCRRTHEDGNVQNKIEILLAEDNPHDAEMTMRTLRKHNFLNQLHWVKDGQEALDFLFCKGVYSDRTNIDPPK